MVPSKLCDLPAEFDPGDWREHKNVDHDRNNEVWKIPHDLRGLGNLKLTVGEHEPVDLGNVLLKKVGVECLVDRRLDVAELRGGDGDRALDPVEAEHVGHVLSDLPERGVDGLELKPAVFGNSADTGCSYHFLDESLDKRLIDGLL